jgi:hypothetical protein
MSRPSCPQCRDSFGVVRVPTLARWADPSPTAWWQPPPAPRRLGRWIVPLTLVGVLVTILTGLHLVWLLLALASGVILELYETWEQAETGRTLRQAQALWRAAYFCTTHDLVFVADGSWLGPPAAFVERLRRGPADESALQPQYTESPGHPS